MLDGCPFLCRGAEGDLLLCECILQFEDILEEREIELKTEIEDADSIRIVVSDTGCGMSRDSKDYIFDKFYQGALPTQKKGTGLALRW